MILAILQARTSSTRLPQKVLKHIVGKPMLSLQIERVLRSKKIDRLLVATSTSQEDDRVEELCNAMRVECFRGSLNDVLDRFYQAALTCQPDHIVRLTGDCPLIDPGIIDEIIDFYLSGSFDYASNALHPTFPDGLDVEVFSYAALKAVWEEAKLPSQREHVTLFINQQPGRFRIGSFQSGTDLSYLRWTVDEPEDFQLVTLIYEALYPGKPDFTMNDVLDLLRKRPELENINSGFSRNEGLKKSLAEDKPHIQAI